MQFGNRSKMHTLLVQTGASTVEEALENRANIKADSSDTDKELVPDCYVQSVGALGKLLTC